MGSANERRRYYVMPSLIGQAHTQNERNLNTTGMSIVPVEVSLQNTKHLTAKSLRSDLNWYSYMFKTRCIDLLYYVTPVILLPDLGKSK